MKYTDIEKQTRLRKERLDPNHYTIALLEEGRRVGLIDQSSLDAIQAEIMFILGQLILKYNQGESSSLKAETAQRILMSIFYAIDAFLSGFQNADDAIAILKTGSIGEIYANGLELLETCLADTRLLYQHIATNKLVIQNEAYNSTIDEALPDFFRNYDILFSAQDTMASIDYPLLFDDMRIQGIFYIKQYLEKLNYETQFCSLFPKENADRVLLNYGRVYRIDYREALINVFEILLTNSIFSVLSGNNALEINISEYQYELLQEKFIGLDQTFCSLYISEAIEVLLNELHLDQPRLRDYIGKFQSILMPRFLNALDHDSLANVIIVDSESLPSELTFDEGKSLNDESFRMVFDEIMECADTADKIALISSSIHSLGDFIDLLEADCLFADEFASLYNTLGDMELSILARLVFIEELRSNPQDFSLLKIEEQPLEMEWQVEYIRFLHSLCLDRLKSIDEYIKSSFRVTGSWGYLE